VFFRARIELEKSLSRQEKSEDKNQIDRLHKVVCFDLQAVLPTPRGEVSSFYYKSKLSTYNFTICELQQKGNGDVHSYMWHEGEGRRGTVEIGSCLLHFFKEQANIANSDNLEIILYSDNCCGQQKNKFIICVYLYAVTNFKIKSITHKFLVTGHTQNEGDAVHSVIEKHIKRSLKSGPIYTPAQYATLIRTSKKTGNPFKVMEMSHDVKLLAETTASNFNRNTEGESFKLCDVSTIKTEKGRVYQFQYKLSYKDIFKVVNVKETKTRKTRLIPFQKTELSKAYKEPVCISKKKFDDLQSLLNSNRIPKCYANFYQSLKYE
jgi:hypothetical protein